MKRVRWFALWCAAVASIFALSSWKGWALTSERVIKAPQQIRDQPGGYRSYTYWRGGK